MSEAGMYGSHAELYDRIYHWKDYAADAEKLRDLLTAEGVPDGGRVLEAACGTGSYLVPLSAWYEVAGFDLSPAVIRRAREKLPAARLFVADMTDFGVDEPHDALLCLFSSIGYLRSPEQLRAAADCFARALRPGGALVVEPWLTAETFSGGKVGQDVVDSDDLVLCRQYHSRVEGELSIVRFHWLVARPDRGTEHFAEEHVMWLCPRDVLQATFEAAGFETRLTDDGLMEHRGLLIGRRR